MRYTLILLICCCSLSAFSQVTTEQFNIEKVRHYFEQVWSRGNLPEVAAFYHTNAKHGDNFSIEGFQKGVVFQREAFPDLKVNIKDIFAVGDKVVTEVEYLGTHSGRRMFGHDAMSKVVQVPGIDIFTFKDGKVIEHQHVADHLDLVLQMGIKLAPLKNAEIVKQEIINASASYNDLMKRIYSGKSYEALMQAGMHDSLSRVLADEFTFVSSKGKVYTKENMLEGLKEAMATVVQSSSLHDQQVRSIDANTAIETGIVTFTGTEKGKAFSVKERYTTTWIWRGGRWQMMADHTSKIE